jgi:Amt family ammonium transporter
VLLYSFVMTTVIGKAIDKAIGFRVARDAEIEGVDFTEHAETAYELDTRTGAGSYLAVHQGQGKQT